MQIVKTFEFPDNSLDGLMKAVAWKSSADIAFVHASLISVATHYLTWRLQREQAVSRARDRECLTAIESSTNQLIAHLHELGHDAEWLLGYRLPRQMDSKGTGVEQLRELKSTLLALMSAAKHTRAEWNKGSDRIPRGELGWAVSELVLLYEQQTECLFSHTRGRNGEPTSEFGCFAILFFQSVDPKVTPSTLSTELARIRRRRGTAEFGSGKAAGQSDSAAL